MNKQYLSLFIYFFVSYALPAQEKKLWHGIERVIHYQPDGEDFITVNGRRRFNRALYGGNTAFRAEAGDLPEFALYLPGMGGNLKFGLIAGSHSKWLIASDKIEARYRPGSMLYKITDALLGPGYIAVTALALYESEGLIVKIESKNVPPDVKLLAVFGGATGAKFSRDGDIGADPESSFYLQPEYCKDNIYSINNNKFLLHFGSRKPLSEDQRYEIQHLQKQTADSLKEGTGLKLVSGIFPAASQLKLADAKQQHLPLSFFLSADSLTPAITTQLSLADEPLYFLIQNGSIEAPVSYANLPQLFNKAEWQRKQIAERIKVHTPDPFINTIGGAISIAADAVWEDPSYMHGAVAWRMRLNGWRGAYAADVLGWHDRARKHFSSYALSQLTTPATAPVVMDTALHLARHIEKLGTSLFSSGYISRNPNGDFRAHHYDMNLVFVDQLLNHFLWTGDTAYVKHMWPLLQRHLAWEKRNFDADDDGLYDAYAAIWASDALQYSGGGTAHSSAYNYRANKMAAQLAKIIGENGAVYKEEAAKILRALNTKLWMPGKGWYAEYKDLSGNKLLHPAAGLWTVYHAIDSHVPDAFQLYQLLKYVDAEIPHIPISAKGLADTTLYTLSTTNWQPYTWSLNNVVLAENMHTALAYWQAGSNEAAYRLWKSTLVESMYLGASPGNIQQLSFYDAIRGELYRDFADGIGITARSLIEGLFGIRPDVLHDTLHIDPGFPAGWQHASINTPDIDFLFERKNAIDQYKIISRFGKKLSLSLSVKAGRDMIESVTVNGKKAGWKIAAGAMELPLLKITAPPADEFIIQIKWAGKTFHQPPVKKEYAKGEIIRIPVNGLIKTVYDPQQVLLQIKKQAHALQATVNSDNGTKTFFVQLQQGQFTYWLPVSFVATKAVQFIAVNRNDGISLTVKNNLEKNAGGRVVINNNYTLPVAVSKQKTSAPIFIPSTHLVAGSNVIRYEWSNKTISDTMLSWDIKNPSSVKYEKVNLSAYFNDEAGNIFKNEYLSPRPTVPTLQLPTQGIGNWAYPLTTASISDSGLRKRAGINKEIIIQQGIPFSTPSANAEKNIVFTSMWDNYPDSINIPLQGKASHAYFLMAGSANAMQSRLVNGEIIIEYTDGFTAKLQLKNPENWWPVEQDYFADEFAFTTGAPKPVRVYLKSGEDTRTFSNFSTIRGFTSRAVDGGAATVLDLPLDAGRELKKLTLKTIANDVVIGLMSVTFMK